MTLAVMGCIVNGPGESKHANIGISLPGTGEALRHRSMRMASNRHPEGRAHSPRIQGNHRALRPAHLQEELPHEPTLQAVRGMPDILPAEAEFWELFEDTGAVLAEGLRLPPDPHAFVEPTPLFKRPSAK